MNHKLELVALAQMMLSVACWSFLAFAVFHIAQTRVAGFLGATLILIFSIQPDIVCMYKTILTESLSFSLMAGIYGTSLLFLNTFKLRWLLVGLLFAFMFAFIRDANAYLVLLIGLALFCLPFCVAKTKDLSPRFAAVCKTVAVLLVVSFLISNISSNIGKRWLFPFYNTISQRILTSPERTKWFQDHGMPVNNALLIRAGKWASSDELAYYRDPDLAAFRLWAIQQGKGTYIKWLITHPIYFVFEPLGDLVPILESSLRQYAPKTYVTPRIWSYRVGTVFLPIWIFIAGVLLSVCFYSGNSKSMRMALFAVLMLGLSIPCLLVVWHGDAMELVRHTKHVAIQIEISLVLIIALSIDPVWKIIAIETTRRLPVKKMLRFDKNI